MRLSVPDRMRPAYLLQLRLFRTFSPPVICSNDRFQYKIQPIVVGTKAFDKSMMTYQFGYGEPYTIPIYCWYLEGGDKRILVDTGEYSPLQSKEREKAIGGKIYKFEEGLGRWGLKPEDIDIVINTNLHHDHCKT